VLSSRVLLVTAAVACLAGLAFSLLPALHAVRVEPAASLKAGAARSPRARVPLRAALVAVQVAVSAVLLAGAGLLLRTLHNALSLDAGFDARGVVVANVNLARAGHDTRSARALLAPLQERLASLAGVRSAALAQRLPLQGSSTTTVSADGHDFVVGYAMASPQYVATLGLRLLRGRDLDARDGPGRPYVGLVNEVLAARLWPGQDPLGRRIDRFSPKRASIEVVGLVRVRAGAPRGAPEPLLILPYAQMYDAFPWQPGVGMVMRSGDVRSTLLALPAAVATLDPALVVQGARTAEQELGLAFAQQRLLAWLLSGFAALALLLAVAGLFGLVSYGTETRRREFGIRAAIGARRRDVVRLVVLDALRPVAAGLALGVPGALACGRALAGQLFGVGYASPTVLGGAAVLLLLAAGAAAAAPARRAASVDPASALRSE
jgi:predicted permease